MADRYWVGGTAAWDGTAGTKWALTSGGAGGEAVPTSADDVFFDAASTGTCTISTGNTGAKSINCTGFTGTLAGTGAISVSGSVTLVAGMTVTYTGTLSLIATGTITSAGKTLGNLAVSGSGTTVTLADALTTGITNSTTLSSGTLALAGFTLSTGNFSSDTTTTRAISFGSGNIALTSTTAGATILSMGHMSGLTCSGTGSFTRNMVSTSTFSLGYLSPPTVGPNLWFTGGSAAITIFSTNAHANSVNFTGNSSTVSSPTMTLSGSLTLSATGPSAYGGFTFVGTGTITSNGKSLSSITINSAGGTITLADAMTLGSSALTLTQGTFNAANFNVTAGRFSSSNSNTRTLNMGSGTWTISGSGVPSYRWDIDTTTGITLNPSTSTITMTSASAKIFAGGGLTYYNLNQGGAGALTIIGSNTFNDITNSVQPATVRFMAGTTQTVSNFSLAGAAGNLVTIGSATLGSQCTLSKLSGTVNAQYLAIQDCNATGGATWNALFSTNLGNNTGWIFSHGNMFLMFI